LFKYKETAMLNNMAASIKAAEEYKICFLISMFILNYIKYHSTKIMLISKK